MATISEHLHGFAAYLLHERMLAPRSVYAYQKDLIALARQHEGRDVAAFTLDHLRAHLRGLHEAGRANGTVLRHMHAIRMFWRYLMVNGAAQSNLAELVALPRRKRKARPYMSEAELYAFAAANGGNTSDDVAMLLLAWLGLRRGEVVEARVTDVHWEPGGALLMVRSKGGGYDPMHVPGPLLTPLQTLTAGRDGQEQLCDGLTRDGLYKRFRARLKRAGLQGRGYTPHTLRHTLATLMARRGVHVRAIQQFMRHRYISTTEKYMQHDPALNVTAMSRHPLADDVAQVRF